MRIVWKSSKCEFSGARCYLKTQEKDDLDDFIEIYSHRQIDQNTIKDK